MDVKALSVWELGVALEGWAEAHTPQKPGGMTAAEEELIWEDVQNWRMH